MASHSSKLQLLSNSNTGADGSLLLTSLAMQINLLFTSVKNWTGQFSGLMRKHSNML